MEAEWSNGGNCKLQIGSRQDRGQTGVDGQVGGGVGEKRE